jgi:hypothetical protein
VGYPTQKCYAALLLDFFFAKKKPFVATPAGALLQKMLTVRAKKASIPAIFKKFAQEEALPYGLL